MSPQLKASFNDEEREAAAAIGTTGEGTLDDKIQELFRSLGDPLLSVSDAAALLLTPDEVPVSDVMNRLRDSRILESSVKTQRPLDDDQVELFRLTEVPFRRLKITGLEARLPGGNQSLFQWTGDGRIVRSIARVSRLNAISGTGAQRKEIHSHVNRIAEGIRQGAQVPNSLLLVFIKEFVAFQDTAGEGEEVPDSYIRIKPLSDFLSSTIPGSPSDQSVQQVRVVEIDIPYRKAAFDEEKVALLVDGQQRTAGLSLVPVDNVPQFDFPVNAVLASEDEAKQIFTLANQTVKIATDFERALVASMGDAPPYLRTDRVPAQACHALALTDTASPFYGIVKYPGVKSEKSHVVAYNTLFLIAHEFCFKTNLLDEEGRQDPQKVAQVLKQAFNVVRETWPDAWAKKPGESRLMHGAGLRSVASLIFEILDRLESARKDLGSKEAWNDLKQQMALLKERVVWTQQEADQAPVSVQKLWETYIKYRQNTSQDIIELTKKLKAELKEALKHQPVN
jgi:DGQHR domain-containing protein